MIKSILKFADQAYDEYETDAVKYECNIPDAFCLKFAELIIAEATKALWSEECMTSDLALEEYSRNSNKIKDHFGATNARNNL